MSHTTGSAIIDALIEELENEYDPNAVRERMNARTLKAALDSAMTAKAAANDDGIGPVIFLHLNADGELIDGRI